MAWRREPLRVRRSDAGRVRHWFVIVSRVGTISAEAPFLLVFFFISPFLAV